MPVIYWAGDSTVRTNPGNRFPQTGIGQEFYRFLIPEITISNHAENGRSTKSFINESRLVPIYDQMKEGDFFFIQFGHNDEKSEDPERYTDPFGEFYENLMKFINIAENKGAYPLLITPIERRLFNGRGELDTQDHKSYCESIKKAGTDRNIPVADLNTKTRELLSSAGELISKNWYMHFEAGRFFQYPMGMADNTHLQTEGAVLYGRLLAEELLRIGGVYKQLILDEIKSDATPLKERFGN